MVYTAMMCACVVIKANDSSSFMYCCRQSVHVCVAAVWVLSDLTCTLFSVAVAVMKLYTHYMLLE